MNYFKSLWNENQQLVLLMATAAVLLLSVLLYAVGIVFISKLVVIFIAGIAAVSLLLWEIQIKTKLLITVIVIVCGFIFEVIGVHSGILFGSISFSSIFGYKLLGVPFTIGLVWLIVTLSAWNITSFGKISKIYKFLLAGGLVLMFDLVLEQFATQFNLWTWKSSSATYLNYISWFLIAELIFYLYYRLDKINKPSLYIGGILPLTALYFWLMLMVR